MTLICDRTYFVKYCRILLNGEVRRTGRMMMLGYESEGGKVLSGKTARNKEQVRSLQGLQRDKCNLCEGLACKEKWQTASLVCALLNIELRRECKEYVKLSA